MRRWLALLVLWLSIPPRVCADEATGRERFEAGVAAAARDDWRVAAWLLEESLAESDRPATRFNLVLVYQELQQPLEVLRHALAFLAVAGARHRERESVEVVEMMREAKAQLSVVDLGELPRDAAPRIDGAAPAVVEGRYVYVVPGPHRLEAVTPGGPSAVTDVVLSAGQVLTWPQGAAARSSRDEAPAEPPQRAMETPSRASERTRGVVPNRRSPRSAVAIATGSAGATAVLAAAACLWTTQRRADDIAHGGVDGTRLRGYYEASERYWRTFDAITPLAITGGALMAAAVVLGPHLTQRGSLAWSAVSLVLGGGMLGMGIYQLTQEPAPLVEGAPLVRPARPAASLLIAGSLPLLSYGFTFIMRRRFRVHASGLSHLGASYVW